MKYPVLTLKQPWAGLVVLGKKTIENRSWKPKFDLPFRLLIHAGQGTDHGWEGDWFQACSSRGIIGAVDVTGFYINAEDTYEGDIQLSRKTDAEGLRMPPKSHLTWLSETKTTSAGYWQTR
jgi:hypothetical protein